MATRLVGDRFCPNKEAVSAYLATLSSAERRLRKNEMTATANGISLASSAPKVTVESSGMPTVSTTIGALFIGWGLSMLIFGLLCLQTWTYFGRYPRDSIRNKILVIWLLTLETLHQILVGHTCWQYTVTDYGLLEEVLSNTTVWSLSTVIVLSGIIAATVKIFLGWRIYRVSRGNYLWAIFLSGLALAQTGLGLVFSVRAAQIPVNKLDTLKPFE
ncbi:unnamed protein product [Peniophora sp. CBMAI 1063]|nr:unnamed protein product [Peniophora sp. CBMAI 1063]